MAASSSYYTRRPLKGYKKRTSSSTKYVTRSSYPRTRIGYSGRYAPAGSELKFYDKVISNFTPTSVGNVVENTINDVAQGVTESQRIGRKMVIRSIHLRAQLLLQTGSIAASTADSIRILLVLDKQANGAAATVADLLENIQGTGNPGMDSFRNLENSGRFRVLKDFDCALSAGAGAWDGTNDQFAEVSKYISWNIPCNIPIEFSSTTGAITEMRSNNVAIMAIAKSGGVININGQTRIRYSDGY